MLIGIPRLASLHFTDFEIADWDTNDTAGTTQFRRLKVPAHAAPKTD